MTDIRRNLADVERRIADAAVRAGRDPGGVRVIAVSKTWPVETIEQARAVGVTAFGENRAQEIAHKAAVLGSDVEWHFVGHLQTNKVRQVVGTAALIHSVDRFGVAEAISQRATRSGLVQPVLLEVNVSGENSKHGVEPGRAAAAARQVAALPGVELRGLMTMAPLVDDANDTRPVFRELAALRDLIGADIPSVTELSMGMTRDFEIGVEEGATLVRIGEAIFGPRNS